ncbi:hypothetical protein [Peptoniphilus harei]|uniref:Uncharacterized protein n=1 Tax=Peptoniphilus harei TaxID=54005 RepID=A0A943Y0H7_9FIRM|nr:hypothetical protein [Peptoniphilus harei]MBS6535398.1 hypothetical protein [Peptoniphilus harei]
MSDEANQAVNQLLQSSMTMIQIVARLVELQRQHSLMNKRMAMEEMKYQYFMRGLNQEKNLEKEVDKEKDMGRDKKKENGKEAFIENPNYLEDHDRESIKNLKNAEEIYERDKDKGFTKAELNRSKDFSNDVAKVFANHTKDYQEVEKKISTIDDEIMNIFDEANGDLSPEQEDKAYELYNQKVEIAGKSLDKLDDVTKDLNKVFKEYEGDFLNKESLEAVRSFEDTKKDLRAVKRLVRDKQVDKTLGEDRNKLSKEYKSLNLSRDLSKLDKKELESLKDDINKWKESKNKLMDNDNIYLEKEFIHFHNDKYNELSDLTDVLNKTENFLTNKLSDIDNLLVKEKNIDNIEKSTKDINVER